MPRKCGRCRDGKGYARAPQVANAAGRPTSQRQQCHPALDAQLKGVCDSGRQRVATCAAEFRAHGTTEETAPMATTPTQTIRMGMVGIGVGGAEVLPAMESTPGIELFAGADINPVTRERFQEKYPESHVYD